MAKLPSSSDVPSVQERRDPGVRAEPGAFQSPLGAAAEEFAPAIEGEEIRKKEKEKALENAAIKQQNRRDIVDRASHINDGTKELSDKLNELNTQSDLSNEGVLAEYGKFATEVRLRRLSEHAGSADSQAILETRLLDVEADMIGRASALSTSIGRDKVETLYNSQLNPLIERASQVNNAQEFDALAIDLETAIGEIRGIDDPKEEQARRSAGMELLALSALNSKINTGRIEEAENLISTAGLTKHLSTEEQASARKRLDGLRFARDEGIRKIAQAEAISGPLPADVKLEILTGVRRTDEKLATKEVFNIETEQFQFATEEQIAADPNLVPKTAGVEEKAPKITASERLAAGFALRTEQASQVIDEVGAEFTGIESRAGGFLPQGLKSDDRQRFEQAQRNFVNSVLRRESGAAIAPTEFESAEQQYFPRPGDGEAVILQKKQNRAAVIQALTLEAGEAFKQLKATVPNQTVKIQGKDVIVGTILTNHKGQKGRVEQDGSITVLGK
jgi:hypothetical protein